MGLFVALLIGLVFVDVIGDSVQDTATTRTTINESSLFTEGAYEVQSVLNDVKTNNKIHTNSFIINNGTNCTIGTNNYNTFTNGSILLNAGMTQDTGQGAGPRLNVTYSYFSANYVRDGTSRTLISLITLFFVIGLLLFVVSKVFKIGPEMFRMK